MQQARITLATITRSINVMPYPYVKSLQLIWKPYTLQISSTGARFQMSCKDVSTWQVTRMMAPPQPDDTPYYNKHA